MQEGLINTEVVPAEVVRPLRRAVLRPHQPPEAAVYREDDAEGTVHVAAYDDAGRLAAVGTFFPDPYPDPDAPAPAWRLRGMASDPQVRGRGYGAAVLRRGMAEAAARGARLLWCNARTPAVPFYERHGLRAVGEEFEVAGIGPHYRMLVELPAGVANAAEPAVGDEPGGRSGPHT